MESRRRSIVVRESEESHCPTWLRCWGEDYEESSHGWTNCTDVNSPAYARLFAAVPDGHDNETSSDTKLTPAREVLRRIQWDYALDEAEFSLCCALRSSR
jgi:hypothetical protein